MSRFFAFLRCWRRTTWRQPPTWQPADARALQAFLASAPGQKLSVILTSEIAAAQERAAMSKGSAFECGWACGYRGLLAWLEALAAAGTEAEPEPEAEDPLK